MSALHAALGAIGKHWRLVLITFFLQFCVAGIASLIVFLATLGITSDSPLFDRAMDGDLSALIVVLSESPALAIVPIAVGLGTLFAYAALSWFMVAGLLGVFRGSGQGESLGSFGHWGARRFFAFARLALWSLILYLLAAVVYFMRMDGVGAELAQALSTGDVANILFRRLGPVLIILWLTWTLIDVARIHLIDATKASAWRAIGRAVKTLTRAPALFAITLAGHILSGIIVVVSLKLLGPGGGIGAFVARQLFLLARHATHVGVLGAEVDRIEPPASSPSG